MKEFGKKLVGVVCVAAVSSAVSIGIYSWMSGTPVTSLIQHEQQDDFASPVSFTSNTPTTRSIETDFTKAAESTVSGVVHIKSTVMRNQSSSSGSLGDPFFDLFFGNRGGTPRTPQPQVGSGSGVIISDDGYIVTNNHVIDKSDMVEVTLADNRTFNATIVGTDPTTDLALLKIEAEGLQAVKFGDSDQLKVGEWVLAVGNPFQLNSTVTAGIVSAKARSIGIINNQRTMGIESFIQTDAAVNPGNSGGALVNTNGELVGINTAIFSETGNFAGYSFAVPSSIVSKVITDLKQYGTVQRAILGVVIQDITADLAKEKNIDIQEGVYIADISDRSAALEAGIEKGDVITSINNVKVKSGAALQEQVSRYRPGDKIQVELTRGKEHKKLSVTLKNQQGNTKITTSKSLDMLGAAFKKLDTKELRELGIRHGVQVTGIKEGEFKEAGIRDGFVIMRINDTNITSPNDVETIFNTIMKGNATDKVMFIVGVYPNGKTGYFAVDLSE